MGKNNADKIILDLCGGTGAWSKPYRLAAGYDVRNITLPHFPLFDVQIGDVRVYEPPADVYGILAAPPCTMFSFCRNTAKKPRDFQEGMEIVLACLHIIWKCRLNNKLQFWALENPINYLRQFLGKAPYVFRQWEFGDKGIKPTEIWGHFNFPRKTVKQKPKELTFLLDINKDRNVARAMTPPGFAKAFFEANP